MMGQALLATCRQSTESLDYCLQVELGNDDAAKSEGEDGIRTKKPEDLQVLVRSYSAAKCTSASKGSKAYRRPAPPGQVLEIEVVVPAVFPCSKAIRAKQLGRFCEVRVAMVDFANRRTRTPPVTSPLRSSHFVNSVRLLRLKLVEKCRLS